MVEDGVSDTLDDPEWVVRWDTLLEVDECEHGGLGIALASHGAFSWAVGMVRTLYPANTENEASGGVFSSLPRQQDPVYPSPCSLQFPSK